MQAKKQQTKTDRQDCRKDVCKQSNAGFDTADLPFHFQSRFANTGIFFTFKLLLVQVQLSIQLLLLLPQQRILAARIKILHVLNFRDFRLQFLAGFVQAIRHELIGGFFLVVHFLTEFTSLPLDVFQCLEAGTARPQVDERFLLCQCIDSIQDECHVVEFDVKIAKISLHKEPVADHVHV